MDSMDPKTQVNVGEALLPIGVEEDVERIGLIDDAKQLFDDICLDSGVVQTVKSFDEEGLSWIGDILASDKENSKFYSINERIKINQDFYVIIDPSGRFCMLRHNYLGKVTAIVTGITEQEPLSYRFNGRLLIEADGDSRYYRTLTNWHISKLNYDEEREAIFHQV